MKESKWQHDINDPAIMHEMYDEYVADAITFMKAHKDYSKVATYKELTISEAEKVSSTASGQHGTDMKKIALLVQQYEKEVMTAQNEMITFFAADDQEPCKHCGRKHPEEVGCTRRKLLEDTLQKLGPLAAQVKKVREVQSKILDGKPPSTAQTKAMEEAAKAMEEEAHAMAKADSDVEEADGLRPEVLDVLRQVLGRADDGAAPRPRVYILSSERKRDLARQVSPPTHEPHAM